MPDGAANLNGSFLFFGNGLYRACRTDMRAFDAAGLAGAVFEGERRLEEVAFLSMRAQNFSCAGRYAQVAAGAVRQEMIAAYASRRNNKVFAAVRCFALGIGASVISACAESGCACSCQQ